MQLDVIGWITANPGLALIGVLASVVVAWAAAATLEAEDRSEAVQGFGQRAKAGTGGALNVVLATIVAMAGWASTTFSTAGEAIAFVVSLAPEAPVLTSSIITIGLGAVGLSDVIVIRWTHFVGLSLSIVILAVAFRTDWGRRDLA